MGMIERVSGKLRINGLKILKLLPNRKSGRIEYMQIEIASIFTIILFIKHFVENRFQLCITVI